MVVLVVAELQVREIKVETKIMEVVAAFPMVREEVVLALQELIQVVVSLALEGLV
jgi:hypothetical protein